MSLADLATEGSFFLALAAGLGWPAYRRLAKNTAQLQHNGGTHVADYARDARDESRRTNEKLDKLGERLSEHMVQSAAKDAELEGKVAVLTQMLK